MKSISTLATDARQSRQWATFLEHIGWKTTHINSTYIFYRTLPLLHKTAVKIQHPKGPLPFEKIEAFARGKHALFTVIEPHSEGFTEADYTKHGYQISKLQFAHSATLLINLQQSEQKLLSSFSENARRNIKKAEKNCEVEIVALGQSKDEKIFSTFYTLYSHVGKIKKFYVPSFHEVSGKLRAFQETSALLFAYDKKGVDRKPIAVLWVGSIDRTLVYFHPGNTEKGYTLLANYLLVWEAMKWGRKKGLTVFDFETAYDPRYASENKQWKGYTEFKKKFGGEWVSYPPSFIKFYNPIARFIYTLGTMFTK